MGIYHYKKKSDGVRGDHEEKSDRVRLHHEKERWVEFTMRRNDGVELTIRKRYGVRVHHEKESDGDKS